MHEREDEERLRVEETVRHHRSSQSAREVTHGAECHASSGNREGVDERDWTGPADQMRSAKEHRRHSDADDRSVSSHETSLNETAEDTLFDDRCAHARDEGEHSPPRRTVRELMKLGDLGDSKVRLQQNYRQ